MNLSCLGFWAVFSRGLCEKRNNVLYCQTSHRCQSANPKCAKVLISFSGWLGRSRVKTPQKKSVKGRHWHIWQPVSKWSNSGTPNIPNAIKSDLKLQEKAAKYLYKSPRCSLWDVWKGNQLCPEPLDTQQGSNCRPVLHTSLRASPLSRSPLITRSIQCWCARTHLLDTQAAAFCPWNMESVAIPMLLSALLETADLDGGNEGMPPICDGVNVSPRPAEHNLCLVASH